MSNPQVELHIQDHGVITLELDADKAPKSVANFLAYVESGHYDQTIFHRVIPGFMVQGGGMSAGMKEKKTGEKLEKLLVAMGNFLEKRENRGFAREKSPMAMKNH